MYIIIWEYQVAPEKKNEFEKNYKADGVWAQLFKRENGYLGTELIHSTEHPAQYLTIDRWDTKENYEAFLSQWNDEYKKLDLMCDGLTEHESCLGRFWSSSL